ncbi:Ig-like domain-containing protein, partial [Thalassiella azotivora]
MFVGFSETMTGFDTTSIQLVRASDGARVPFTYAFYPTINRLTINPYSDGPGVLASGTQYRVTLTGGPTAIRTTTDVPLETTSWTFTT